MNFHYGLQINKVDEITAKFNNLKSSKTLATTKY